MDLVDLATFVVLLVVVPGALLVAGAKAMGKRRRLVRTPTRPVRKLRVGTVEVAGRAVGHPAGKTYVSPFQGLPCAFAAWRIEEDRGRQVRTVLQGDTGPFLLEDATGRVLVDPAGASFDASMDLVARSAGTEDLPPRVLAFLARNGVGSSGYTRRYLEFAVPEGGPVFVHGRAQKDRRGLELLERRATASALAIAQGSRTFVVAAKEDHARSYEANEAFWLLGGGALLAVLGVLALLDYFGRI